MEFPFVQHADEQIPPCPICGDVMEVVYSRLGENVAVCVGCQSGLTIPRKAWEIARVKRAQQIDPPDEKAS
jgi:uncharacterized protein YbbK (DUF523 family)